MSEWRGDEVYWSGAGLGGGVGCAHLKHAPSGVGWHVGEGAIVSSQVLVQEWQSYFIALAGASAALAGLVFVAMSLHPQAILANPLTRAQAFAAAFGFLLGVAWALIMLLPAHSAPVGSLLLIAVGVGGSIFVVYRQIQIRKIGMNVARAVLADLLVPAPVIAGLVGLLQPQSEFPFLLLAVAAGAGLFVLFSQSWTLVLRSVTNVPDSRHQESGSANRSEDSEGG
jgi:hypothetical protein